MARGQSQFLRIFDEGGTYHRWQSYYINASVTIEGEQWDFMQFGVEGLTSGQTGDEGGVTVSLPGTALVMEAISEAFRNARLVEILMYQFDTIAGNDVPQETQQLTAVYVGEVVNAGGLLESFSMELGSSLSPVGAQVPPRKFTTKLIGVPCKL
jgi:hypothetical protein